MSSRTSIVTPQTAPPAPGLAEALRDTVLQAGRFAALRLALLRAEAGEAAGHFRRVALAAVVACIAAGLAWIGFCAALVLWISQRWSAGNPVPPLLGVAGFHLLVAAAAAVWLMKRGRHPRLFAASREEFAEDRKYFHS